MRDIGRKGYTRVGKLNRQDIYEKDGKLAKEVDHRRLVELTPGEREQFEDQKLKIALDK